MPKILILLIINIISGCAYTVFAPPKILYSTDSTIGVKYRSEGVQSHDEAGKAMMLVSNHCSDKYMVSGRTEENGWTTVDAKCE